MDHLAGEGFLGVKFPVHHGPEDGCAGLAAVKEMVAEAHSTFDDDTETMIEGYIA